MILLKSNQDEKQKWLHNTQRKHLFVFGIDTRVSRSYSLKITGGNKGQIAFILEVILKCD